MGFLDSLKEKYDEANQSYVPTPLELIQKGVSALQTSPEEIKARTDRAMARAHGLPLPEETAPVVSAAPVAPVAPVQAAQPAVSPVSVAPTQVAMPAVSPVDAYKQAFAQGQQIANAMPQAGINMQMAAAKKIGEIGEQAGAEQARIFEEQAKSLQDQAQRSAMRQAQQKSEMEDFDKKYQEIEKEDEGKVDFNRFFKNQSTGNKILSGLSLALSVFGGAGSTSKVIGIIDDAVNKDIEAQKFEVAQKGAKKLQKLKSMDNMYARMLDKYGDADKADAATRAILTDKISNQVNALASRTSSQTAKAQAQNIMGELQGKKDAIASQLGLSLGAAAATATPATGQSLPANYTPKTEDDRKRFVKGIGLAATTEDANKIKEGAENIDGFNRNVNKLLDLRKKYGSETLPTAVKGEMKAISTELQMGLKKSLELGVLNQSDYDILYNLVPDPTSYNPRTAELYNNLKARTNAAFQDKIKYRILNPLQGSDVEQKYQGFK